MKNVRTMLAAAVLGVSAMTMPAGAADEFKKTAIDDIPREARQAIQDKTKDKQDLQVYTRQMKDGEDQYTAFYMDDGKRMELRVDKNGKVTSPAHETREQPGDKDRDTAKDDSKHHNDKDKDKQKDKDDLAVDYKREPAPASELPKPAQEALFKELHKAGAKDGDYFRLRRDGDDIYSMFYTPEGGQRQEVRVDKSGKLIGHYGPRDKDNDVATTKPSHEPAAGGTSDTAAQPAASRQPADKPAAKAPADSAPKAETPTPTESAEALKEIKQDDLPEPVRKAFAFPTRGASAVEYRTFTRDGKAYYSVFYMPKGSVKLMELRTDAEGKPLEDAHEAQAKDKDAAKKAS